MNSAPAGTLYGGSPARHTLSLDMLAYAIQKHDAEFWREYSRDHTDVPEAVCPNCGVTYHPLTKKQKACSRRCTGDLWRDAAYFGGNRRNTIGLAEKICQLCQQHTPHGLSSHHLIGKENDPKNEYLIALCRGCHKLVTMLGARNFIETEDGWETLIQIVLARRSGAKRIPFGRGTYVTVEIEYLSKQKTDEWIEFDETEAPHAATQ